MNETGIVAGELTPFHQAKRQKGQVKKVKAPRPKRNNRENQKEDKRPRLKPDGRTYKPKGKGSRDSERPYLYIKPKPKLIGLKIFIIHFHCLAYFLKLSLGNNKVMLVVYLELPVWVQRRDNITVLTVNVLGHWTKYILISTIYMYYFTTSPINELNFVTEYPWLTLTAYQNYSLLHLSLRTKMKHDLGSANENASSNWKSPVPFGINTNGAG